MILYLSIYSIIISIVIAIHNWSINKNALLLSGIFIIFSTYSLAHYFSSESSSPFWVAIFYSNFSPLWYLPGPFLYFYTRNTLTDKSIFYTWKDYLHLLPFLIQFANMYFYIFSPFQNKLEVAKLIIQDLNNIKYFGGGVLYPPVVAIISRPVLVIIYSIASALLLLRFDRLKLKVRQYRFVIIWISVLITTIFIIATSYFILTLLLFETTVSRALIQFKPAHIVSGIAFFLLPTILFVFFPNIVYGMPIVLDKKSKNIKKNRLENFHDPLIETTDRILAYLKNDKPFLKEKFDITDISENLDIPKHHIAYCFSILLNMKFTAYRSKLRVDYAKELLDQGTSETLSMDGIGTQSGFSSRSGFFATFKAETGMTPTQYLEQKAFK